VVSHDSALHHENMRHAVYNSSSHFTSTSAIKVEASARVLTVCAFGADRTLTQRRNTISGRLYKDDASIFAWDLVNEPRCETWRVMPTAIAEKMTPLVCRNYDTNGECPNM
jgi:hypothetical protein